MDFSLLRPFNLDSAKSGAPICWHSDAEVASNVFFTDDHIIPIFKQSYDVGQCGLFNQVECDIFLRMAPLFWLDDKPVYKGDTIYKPEVTGSIPLVVDSVRDIYVVFADGNGTDYVDNRRGYMTWTNPTTKRVGWIAIQADKPGSAPLAYCSHVCQTRDDALKYYGENVEVYVTSVEWEE